MTPADAHARCSRRSLLQRLTAVVVWPTVTTASQAVDDTHRQEVPLARGAALSLRSVVGAVRVTATPGRETVQLSVTRRAERAVIASSPIAVDATATGTHIDVTPGLRPGTRGLSADVVLEVPPDVRLEAVEIEDGRLDIDGLTGAIRGRVTRGDIRATNVRGVVRLETSIGDVSVTRARLTAGGLLRLRAFNGDVRLAFEAPPEDARIMALALNGTVTSAIPLTSREAWGPRWGETSIGRADRVVSLDVVTGTIRIEVPGGR